MSRNSMYNIFYEIYMKMGAYRLFHYRLSDIVAGICIPTTLILSIHVTFLSREVRNASINFVDYSGSGFPLEDVSNEIQTQASIENTLDMIEFEMNGPILVAPPLNNTGKGQEKTLILTSIPRTGQSNLRSIIKRLKIHNEYLTISPPKKQEIYIDIPSKTKRKTVVDRISSLDITGAIIDHFAFINFNEFGKKQPIQVSMVRDPIERAISMYYYVRAPFSVVEEYARFPSKNLPNRRFLRKSIEQCLRNASDVECAFAKNSVLGGHTIQFFCGHEPFCKLFGNEEGLEKAKKNVEESFAVVGVLEELEKSLIVLEHYVPKFFKGAYRNYLHMKKKDEKGFRNRNMYKPPVDEAYRSILEIKFAVERKFYNFLKERLNKQYEKLLERSDIQKKLNSSR